MPNKKHFGFTLIELLVVISIIGVLATLVTANLNAARARARDAARKSDLKNVSTALRLYYNDRGAYPTNTAAGLISGCGSSGTSNCVWGDPWVVGTTTYMGNLPDDPLPTQDYKYEVGATRDTFTLSACLENKSDESGVTSTDSSWCPSAWQFQVKI
jgi:type II secretion system protein G